MVLVFKNVWGRATAKDYHPVSLLFVIRKVLEKLVNNRLLITQGNVVFFPISSMVLDLLDQLQILSQLYLIELLGVLTSLGLLEL